jgi:hypothetical protein
MYDMFSLAGRLALLSSSCCLRELLRLWRGRTGSTCWVRSNGATRAAFTEMVREEYRFLLQELERNPQALFQRLGVNMGRTARQRVYRRQGLGELAVRTAVRATVWEMIWSLFRR